MRPCQSDDLLYHGVDLLESRTSHGTDRASEPAAHISRTVASAAGQSTSAMATVRAFPA